MKLFHQYKLFSALKRTEYAAAALVLMASVLLGAFRVVQSARALSDTTPMELVSLSVGSSSVDVSTADAYVDLTGEVFEDLSGFGSIQYYYTSPSGQQIIEGDANGDPQFINELIRFPQYSEAGLWRPTFTLVDLATNSVTLTPNELANLGFSLDITVLPGTHDTTAPSLDTLAFNASTIDVSNAEQYYLGDITLTEDLAGTDLNRSYVQFTSPSGNQKSTGFIGELGNGEYIITTPFRQYAETGTWELAVTLVDAVGNTRSYDSDDLALLNLPNSVEVTGVQDTTNVTINSLDFTASYPPASDIIPNSAKVTIYGEFIDNLSGVGNVDLNYHSQTSNQVAPGILSTANDDYVFTIFMPVYAAEGDWLPRMVTTDVTGNTQVLEYADLVNLGFDLKLSIAQSETEAVVEDGTITTDITNDGATPSDPFEASVTTPLAGDVTITQVALTEPLGSNDYLVFDQQYDISAPVATPEDPLVLTFRVDQSKLQGQTAATLAVFRNGVLVENCVTPGVTDPDPCVDQRSTLGDGDVELTVRTSQASIWFIGYEVPTGPTYNFVKFKNPVKPAPKLNSAEDGQTVPVKFSLGGDYGLAVLPAGIATSQRIKCNSKEPIGEETAIRLTNGGGLSINDNSIYSFKWKTLSKWDDTCRQLILRFSNGEVVTAYFKFD